MNTGTVRTVSLAEAVTVPPALLALHVYSTIDKIYGYTVRIPLPAADAF